MPIKSIKFKVSDKFKNASKDEKAVIRAKIKQAIRDSLIAAQSEVKKNIIPGWNIGHRAPRSSAFTGKLNQSITIDESQIERLRGILGANKKYAAIQEFGGEIRAVRAKALFVPLTRLGAKIGPQAGGSPLLKYGKDFIFRKTVQIKPKGYFGRGITAAGPLMAGYLSAAGVDIGSDFGFE